MNHRWNGVTTLHFAKVSLGLVKGEVRPRSLHHLVPDGEVTKFELLQLLAEAFGRKDLEIMPAEGPDVIDRTLATDDEEANVELWRGAGYSRPPSVAEMTDELGAYCVSWTSRRPLPSAR
jgi:dTDP-4-dehydrorhamnose reductase